MYRTHPMVVKKLDVWQSKRFRKKFYGIFMFKLIFFNNSTLALLVLENLFPIINGWRLPTFDTTYAEFVLSTSMQLIKAIR